MNPEVVVNAWLKDTSIAALIGTRFAAVQLPQGTTYPALTYTVVDALPEPNVNPFQGTQLIRARVHFNPLAANMGSVKAIHQALAALMDFKHQVSIGGKLVISARRDMLGPPSKDNEAGVYTQPIDFIIRFYE